MKSKLYVPILLIIFVLLASSCGPYKGTTVVQIGPNQTAFLLPAQGDTTTQKDFNSVTYLQTNQVASKLVEISFREHTIGRGPFSYDFVPNNILVLVDRKPVSRQWTYSDETGTAAKNEAIALESKESIGFSHGVVVNAVILEEDAAKFLYYYGGAGISGDPAVTGIQLSVGLDQVVDTFVKTWVSGKLYTAFKALTLAECQEQAGSIFAQISDEATTYFKEYGITILSLGGIEGLVYDNESVQTAIDSKFNVASQATAQAITNNLDIVQAAAQATVTVQQAQAQAAALKMTGEELARYPSLINKALADKSTGAVPQVLVVNTDNGTSTMPFPFWFYYPPTASSQPTPTAVQAIPATETPMASQ